MLTNEQAFEAADDLRKKGEAERSALDEVRRYWTGRQSMPIVVPQGAPREVYEMARMSRVNIVGLVVESMSQSLFVDGFRGRADAEDSSAWDVWQANKMDAGQAGLHRAALAYGTAYAIVLPGDPAPIIKRRSPRKLTAGYLDLESEWPELALEWLDDGSFRLYDAEHVYRLKKNPEWELSETADHDAGVCPVVRFREADDLDSDNDVTDDSVRGIRSTRRFSSRLAAGQVAPLMANQDQIDLITFNLLVAQHYAAFKQRYVIGWLADTEKKKAEASAARLWTFEDPEVKVGSLEATELDGYIKAREASLRHAASLSQTPAHELIGELVNLSAEALAAAESGRDRKVASRQTLLGESHEQMLRLAAQLGSVEVAEDAEVKWRDTSARSFAAVVDALGKLAQTLQIPVEELWERVPGVTQQDIARWKKAKADDAAAPPANQMPPTPSGDQPTDQSVTD